MKTNTILNLFFLIITALCLLACSKNDKTGEAPNFQVIYQDEKDNRDTSYYYYSYGYPESNSHATLVRINDSTVIPVEKIIKITKIR